MRSAPKIVTVDKKMLSAVENIIKLTWRADIVGHGQDAVNLSHSKIKGMSNMCIIWDKMQQNM